MTPARPSPIAYTRPSVNEDDVAMVLDAARNGWGPRCYEYIHRFEAEFAAFVGSRYAVATSSCTGAMHLGLAAAGIGAGDEVILADTNWIATVSPIVHLGARPVFTDIDPHSWCADPDSVKAALTPRTKAVVATHLYGNLCDMGALTAICEQAGVLLVEDAAEALGSRYRGRHAGSIGAFGTFSFHGSKTLTTGEGGMLVTSDERLYRGVQTLANHGRAPGETRQFWPVAVGYKYKISNLQAALGCAQLARLDALVARKREILERYRQAVADLKGFEINPVQPDCETGAWMPTVVWPASWRLSVDEVAAAFRADNIDARVFFHPLSSLPMFEGSQGGRVARDIAARAFNLPSYHDMTDAEIERVISVLRQLQEEHA